MNTVFLSVREEDITFLLHKGFTKLETTQESQIARYQKAGCTVTLFSSGKLLVQHKDDQEQEIQQLFFQFDKKESQAKPSLGNFDDQSIFGSDETLKGDTFGGLIVSGFSYEPYLRQELEGIGIGDSKTLSDERILRLARILEETYPTRCITIELDPEMYNGQLEQKPLTQLLNELHAAVATHKKPGQQHLVDKYPGCTAGDIAVTKAESQSLAVAAASILARARGVQQFHKLSVKAGFDLPLGSTHVREALLELIKRQEDLRYYAKLHFKNVQEALKTSTSGQKSL